MYQSFFIHSSLLGTWILFKLGQLWLVLQWTDECRVHGLSVKVTGFWGKARNFCCQDKRHHVCALCFAWLSTTAFFSYPGQTPEVKWLKQVQHWATTYKYPVLPSQVVSKAQHLCSHSWFQKLEKSKVQAPELKPYFSQQSTYTGGDQQLECAPFALQATLPTVTLEARFQGSLAAFLNC